MRCPFCSAEETKVVDSRLANDGYSVRRRRQCLSCNERFTTFESADMVLPAIIKMDGRREAFSELKLRSGLQSALQKRPVSAEQIEALVDRIKHRLYSYGEREINARQIGEWLMDELRDLDKIAYVRFASVYRSFEDVNEFREEIERLESTLPSEFERRQISLIPAAENGKTKPEKTG